MHASARTAGALALLALMMMMMMMSSSVLASDIPTSCCFSYTKKKIPRSHVIDFYETNGRCSKPAVVFITRRKLQICTNPSEQWVQDHVNFLKANRIVHATEAPTQR